MSSSKTQRFGPRQTTLSRRRRPDRPPRTLDSWSSFQPSRSIRKSCRTGRSQGPNSGCTPLLDLPQAHRISRRVLPDPDHDPRGGVRLVVRVGDVRDDLDVPGRLLPRDQGREAPLRDGPALPDVPGTLPNAPLTQGASAERITVFPFAASEFPASEEGRGRERYQCDEAEHRDPHPSQARSLSASAAPPREDEAIKPRSSRPSIIAPRSSAHPRSPRRHPCGPSAANPRPARRSRHAGSRIPRP